MDENEVSNSDKFKHGMCYVPFGGVVLFFTENDKSKELMKHIKYSTFLLVVFMLLNLIFGLFMIRGVGGIFFVIYAGVTGFLGWKAYNGDDVQLTYVDDFEQKIKDNMNDDTVEGKTETKKVVKKDDNKDDNKDEDILDF